LFSFTFVAGEILGIFMGGLPSGNIALAGSTFEPETPNKVS
jgi:hypothetical protein